MSSPTLDDVVPIAGLIDQRLAGWIEFWDAEVERGWDDACRALAVEILEMLWSKQ